MKTITRVILISLGIMVLVHFLVNSLGFKQSAIHAINQCNGATEALGVPIEENVWAFSYGNVESSGGSGNASWRMGVDGPRGSGKFEFYTEKHGGVWNLTAAQVTVDGKKIDFKNCGSNGQADAGQNGGPKESYVVHEIENCNDGNADSCQTLGVLYLRGTAVEKNLKQAKFYLEKSCDLEIQKRLNQACDYAIRLFTDGKEAVADPFEVARLKQKLGGLSDLVHADQVKDIISTNEKECNSNSVNALNSCIMLGRQYVENPEIKRDLKKAHFYISRACDPTYLKKHTNIGRNPWAECYYVTEFYHEGKFGFPVDLTQAMKFAETICDLDFQFKPFEARGCTESAKLIDQLIGKGSPQAAKDRKRACESGDSDSCS